MYLPVGKERAKPAWEPGAHPPEPPGDPLTQMARQRARQRVRARPAARPSVSARGLALTVVRPRAAVRLRQSTTAKGWRGVDGEKGAGVLSIGGEPSGPRSSHAAVTLRLLLLSGLLLMFGRFSRKFLRV